MNENGGAGANAKTILLVEDEALIALAEKRMLEKYGYAVLTAMDGERAVEAALSQAAIDLVLMDINLGGTVLMRGRGGARFVIEFPA